MVPRWGGFKTGINDRFQLGTRHAMLQEVMGRRRYAATFCAATGTGFHSELFMRWVLLDHLGPGNVTTLFTERVLFQLVRSDGSVVQRKAALRHFFPPLAPSERLAYANSSGACELDRIEVCTESAVANASVCGPMEIIQVSRDHRSRKRPSGGRALDDGKQCAKDVDDAGGGPKPKDEEEEEESGAEQFRGKITIRQPLLRNRKPRGEGQVERAPRKERRKRKWKGPRKKRDNKAKKVNPKQTTGAQSKSPGGSGGDGGDMAK